MHRMGLEPMRTWSPVRLKRTSLTTRTTMLKMPFLHYYYCINPCKSANDLTDHQAKKGPLYFVLLKF